jgi:uncharacterized repeat protein (TIGR03803 family)
LELWQLEERSVPSTLITLASFNNTIGTPYLGSLLEDSSGNFFGTTGGSSGNGNGTVFELPRGSNTIITLASFTHGEYPADGLVEDSSGNLFGTTLYGGVNNTGTVFELAQGSSTITTLAVFYSTNNPIGIHPNGGLVEDSSGNVFGTTSGGGAHGDGTVFELMKGSSTITDLADFNPGAGDGNGPSGGLIEDSNGNLLGTTNNGGAYGVGTVFELAHGSNTITTLASFNNTHNLNGINPFGNLVEDSSGNLFGTTYAGGAYNYGTVFELAHGSNTITTLAFFTGTNGANPQAGLVEDTNGNLYGTTFFGGANNEGTVFELAKSSSTITDLVSFSGSNGSSPYSGLIEDSSGNLFGTTTGGGANGVGTLFELDQGPTISMQPQNAIATAGQTAPVSFTIADSGGNAPLTVQWEISTNNGSTFSNLSNGGGVAGATTTTLTLSGFAAAGSAEYLALVTDANGVRATSDTATLFINAAPTITTQPASQTATAGQAASESFSVVVANGTNPLTFQWKVSTDGGKTFNSVSNGSGISGATSATLTISSSSLPASGTEYKVVVTDANGVIAISTAATLTISAPPPSGVISGTVFHDFNTNGVQDPGEPGIAGQKVFLDLDGSGVLKSGDPAATTDANGNYTLTGLADGTYTVREVLLGGVLLSAPDSSSYQVTLANGTTVSGENFADMLTSIGVPLTLPPSSPFPSQGSANADYVEALYRSILDRNADAGGLAGWTNTLNNQTLTRLQVVQGIRNSPEHFRQEVTDFYFTLLGRAPDSSGLQNWVQKLEAGMREEQMAFYFLDSAEYLSQGDKNFVDAMYQSLLGRSFDTAGEANWLSQLGDDTTSGNPTHPASLTHEQVIAAFLYSTESETRLTEGYYEVFLQRPADAAGLNGWLGHLQQGAQFLSIGQQFSLQTSFTIGQRSRGKKGGTGFNLDVI